MKRQTKSKSLALRALGMLLCTLPPALATVSFFPLWMSRGSESVLSGFTVLLLAICALPLWRALKRLLSSPSIHTVWLIFFLCFLLLSKIADEMTVIGFVGFISSSLGAICFHFARRGEDSEGAE
ncbi:MAG: hypothetical protein IKA64_00565 [Clostridia bacterium]|nr:hypothetical protein [Clostridia bacterium]